ncbi:MAG: sigma-70 family RNA polymerase sigma factor [Melioribacteraceae bacterium]|nr:sigma-70 family RNA polymerase sigma factor [Melioribacteraceae bacterium]
MKNKTMREALKIFSRYSDLELIAMVKDGDTNAFRDIIRRYEPKVAATVKGILGDTLEAEDVGQEVFIRFYKSLNNFRGDSSLGTYLIRIAINLSLNEIKVKKRRSISSFEDWHESDSDFQNFQKEFKSIETKEIVYNALQQIPAKFRTVVVFRLMNGFSTEETAKILGVPLGTVLSRLARGQKKLREILSPQMEGK